MGAFTRKRVALSDAGRYLANLIVNVPITDPMSGYFIVRCAAIDLTEFQPLGYKILLEVLARGKKNLCVVEVGYVFQERREGGSKVTWRQWVQYLVHLWRLRGVKRREPA